MRQDDCLIGMNSERSGLQDYARGDLRDGAVDPDSLARCTREVEAMIEGVALAETAGLSARSDD